MNSLIQDLHALKQKMIALDRPRDIGLIQAIDKIINNILAVKQEHT